MTHNQSKVIVAYRVVPGESDNCIVVNTSSLSADEHDTLMKTVESNAGQTAYEFAEAMARTRLPDGRNMLAAFHKTGRMMKVSSSEVEMTPDTKTVIGLKELNQMIADQRGVTIEDLALQESTEPKTEAPKAAPKKDEIVLEEYDLDTPADVLQQVQQTEVLTDEELAAQYRSQADAMFKEAKRLREQAEELVPTKKKPK